jgi:hypothetical protein
MHNLLDLDYCRKAAMPVSLLFRHPSYKKIWRTHLVRLWPQIKLPVMRLKKIKFLNNLLC